MRRRSNIWDFFKTRGEYSHTRLISIIGSFVVFVVFCLNPTNTGIQNLMFGILAASLTNATISKFAKQPTQEEENN